MPINSTILFIELFRNSFSNTCFPKSIEPSTETLRCINLLKENNFHVDFLDIKTTAVIETAFIDQLNTKNYSFIFIDAKSYNKKQADKIITLSKTNSMAQIFCFGQFPSYCYSELIEKYPNITVIKNETYAFFMQFVKAPFTEDIKATLPNLIYKDTKTGNTITTSEQEIINLDSLPVIDTDILQQNNYYTLYPMKTLKGKWGFINLTKGCQFKCIYCSQTLRISHGNNIYTFTPQEALRRIKRLTNTGFNRIRFIDDNFFASPVFVKELLSMMAQEKLKITWMAQARPDSITPEIIELCAQTGCECLNIGVESGSDRILEILKKQIKISDIINAFNLCKQYNIMTVAYIMIGSPSETISDIEKTISLIKQIKPTMLQIAYFTPYPTSPYFEANKKESDLKDNREMFHYSKPLDNLSQIETKQLHQMMRKIIVGFYLNPKYSYCFYRYCFISFLANPFFTLSLTYKTLKYILFSLRKKV